MLNILEYRSAALAKLSLPLADYIERKAGFGKTFDANLESYSRYKLIPRVLKKIEEVDTSVTIMGEHIKAPIIIAPTPWHKMFCDNGEKDTFDATCSFGIPYIISSFSTCDFSEIGSNLSNVWYQLLVYRDKELMKKYIVKAEKSGCSAIVLTIDAPLGCSMCKQVSSGTERLEFPIHNLPLFPHDPTLPYATLDEYYKKYINSSASWEDIKEIISFTRLPVILKGILHPVDVEQAISYGAKGIIISNHGGRQLDGAISSLEALSLLSNDFKNTIDIYMDGGILSGIDIFKASALGAKAVLIGRAALYGLIVGGHHGLVSLLNLLNQELKECMHMTGCADIKSITRDLLHPQSGTPRVLDAA